MKSGTVIIENGPNKFLKEKLRRTKVGRREEK